MPIFELRNVPFYAYGLNFLDIVRAVEPSPDKKPVVPERPDLMRRLNDHRAYVEGAKSWYFAINVEPGGHYAAVRAQFDEWEEAGFLEYGTFN